MKKYSKTNLKKKKFAKFLLVFFVIVLVASISILVFVKLKKNVIYTKVDDSALEVSDDVSANSTPIIINNLLVGGVYDKKWVSSQNYYLKSKNSRGIDIDMYNKEGKIGKYSITNITKPEKSDIYISISKTNSLDEYLAVAASDNNIMKNAPVKNMNVNEEDIKNIKKAIGAYKIFNSSVKINEKYDITLNEKESGTLLFATNEINKGNGVYSTVVYVSGSGKVSLVKYNYFADKENASDWPIYSYGFVADLNNDGKNEIILQETKEFEVVYSVMEFKNNKFYEVLTSSLKK